MSNKIILTNGIIVGVRRISTMAESFTAVEYVTVTRSIPAYSTVQEEIPSEKCYDVQEKVNSGGGTNNDIVWCCCRGSFRGCFRASSRRRKR